ncbi:uncharacterized protein LTR77_010373 [Saxophila tyrrhenica]|uniref:Uncharacterized protein n=1 Tax=Saxophila tyrrhenica TaxID=1690608 RepID=A0AAV9NV92_9PEZI|nr:hypothetical protein LTR77_010373 [Saxophila tyrrhenica]
MVTGPGRSSRPVERVTDDALSTWATGKVAIITGAASGIGLALSRILANAGARVVLVDRDEQLLLEATQSLNNEQASSFQCDITSWAQQASLLSHTVERFGPPHLVCLNAGTNPELAYVSGQAGAKASVQSNYLANDTGASGSGELAQPSDLVFDVNVKGVLYGIKLALHHAAVSSTTGLHIIVTGSAASYIGFPLQDVYVTSKHAALGLVRATSRRPEVLERQVVLAMVAPWYTLTPMVSDVSVSEDVSQSASQPEDVAWAVATLASTSGEGANGKCVWVRGKECVEVEDLYQAWLDSL